MKNPKNTPAVFNIQDKLIPFKGQYVLCDADVAAIYGVETKRVNEAVRNNPEKFPEGYILDIDYIEIANLRSKISTSSDDTNNHGGRRYAPKFFTEKGLYMLATILKSPIATQATLLIVETFAKVRELKQELVDMQTAMQNASASPQEQKNMMHRFGEVLSDIVMPDLQTYEAETALEVNFVIGKLKYTVKRRKEPDQPDRVE